MVQGRSFDFGIAAADEAAKDVFLLDDSHV